MPEGDAVRRTARKLDEALAGGVLVRADLRVPRFATVDLRGARVLGTGTLGKHLLTRMELDGRALTLHSHLRMDGSWRIGPPGPPRAPAHLVRVVLATAQAQAVGVHLHEVAVARTDLESQWVGHLGPDILAECFDAEDAVARVSVGGRPLVETLLDQRVLAGLGTMWAAEAAHHAQANPWADPAAVAGLAEALADVRERMLAAVESGPRAGRRDLAVFERVGQPCRRCGTAIRSGRVGSGVTQRLTYWCPGCQP